MKKYIPLLNWIRSYSKNDFLKDLPAGLTVGVMLIPQGMAYAMIAGLPPIYGLYAGLVPPVVYAIFGTSKRLSVGPVAMDSLLVAAGLSLIATAGSENYIALAVLLAFLMGSMQLLMGVLKLGAIANFLSKPVISGFTSAAAIIIGLNQLKHLLGTPIEGSSQLHIILKNAYYNLNDVHLTSLFIGIVGIIVIKALKEWLPKLPGALIVVVLGIIGSHIFKLSEHGVLVVGEIPEGLPSFALPDFSTEHIGELLPIAFTLSLIAFVEAVTLAKAIQNDQTGRRVNPNQELIALGFSNLIGSLFSSYVTTGGLSRTAVNKQVGARTAIAGVIASIVIALALLFLTSLFTQLPKTILASIIMAAVFGLVDLKYPKRLWKNRKEEFVLLLFTFILTLFVGVREGLIAGVLLSLLLLIYRTTKPHIAVLGKLPESNSLYKNVKRFPNAEQREDILIIRFDAQLYFANADYFKEEILHLISERNHTKLLIISAEGINFIDSSATHMLRSLVAQIKNKNIQINITNAIGPVRDIFKKSDVRQLIGEDGFFITVEDAIQQFDGETSNDQSAALQSNV